MAPTKKRPLVLILVMLVLLSVRFTMHPNVQLRIQEFRLAHGLIFQTPQPPSRAEYVARAYSNLEKLQVTNSVYNTGDVRSWLHCAYVVGLYGEPDDATESIIDRIQNRDDLRAEDFKWSNGRSERFIVQSVNNSNRRTYRVRLSLLSPLGLTGTKRAEEFLVKAYMNPHTVDSFEKYQEYYEKRTGLVSQRDISITSHLTPSYLEIILSLRILESALLGLMYLNEEKYSPMVEAEYDRLLSDSQIAEADAGAIYKNEYYRLFPEALKLDSKNIPGEFFLWRDTCVIGSKYTEMRLSFATPFVNLARRRPS